MPLWLSLISCVYCNRCLYGWPARVRDRHDPQGGIDLHGPGVRARGGLLLAVRT